ncbi:hypothetical protein [Hymenobacter armeniacus]|uniref:Uncharacterized protein n=1 Tax=Hymenobacter armeniacus TaxID=2771358 RepID=A0ABR8JSR9_9BACT|nr:hypothetical protein [Hymenobacter armeniacus]MBD2721818.1 hypothetical protein [Hymenobacter armeniacus]
MKKLNVAIGLIFGIISLGWLLAHNWLAAAACGTLALGFGFSDLAYAPALTTAVAAAPALPGWRRYGSMLLVGVAILLFGYQIGQDLRGAVHSRPAESTTPR